MTIEAEYYIPHGDPIPPAATIILAEAEAQRMQLLTPIKTKHAKALTKEERRLKAFYAHAFLVALEMIDNGY